MECSCRDNSFQPLPLIMANAASWLRLLFVLPDRVLRRVFVAFGAVCFSRRDASRTAAAPLDAPLVNYLVERKIATSALVDDVAVDAVLLGKVGGFVSDAFNRQIDSVFAVSRLLFGRGPIAVFRRIGSVVVSTFYGVMGARLIAHVRHKLNKGLPLWAARNPATSVSRIILVVREVATFAHIAPHAIKRVLFVCHGASYSMMLTGRQ